MKTCPHEHLRWCYTMGYRYVIRCQLSPKSSQPTLHNSPVRARYFVSSVSDLCFTTVNSMLYVISWCIRPRYNDTRLYYNFTYRLVLYSWVSLCRTNHRTSKAFFTVWKDINTHSNIWCLYHKVFKVFRGCVRVYKPVVTMHGPWYHVCHISVLMSDISAGVTDMVYNVKLSVQNKNGH